MIKRNDFHGAIARLVGLSALEPFSRCPLRVFLCTFSTFPVLARTPPSFCLLSSFPLPPETCVHSAHPFLFCVSATRSAGSEYCSRDLCFPFVFRVCCCNVICSVRHAATVFCSATPVTKQACMTFVCIQRTKATGPVQFLKARTDTLWEVRSFF